MAFPEIPPSVPTSIGEMRVYLRQVPAYIDADGIEQPEVKEVLYDVSILDQDGRRIETPHDSGNLIPYLTTPQKNGLLQFMTDLRAQAEDQFLP